MAKNVADDMLAEIIVIDGNLQCTLVNEKNTLMHFMNPAQK